MKINKIIDLSVTIEPGMATWPTNPEIVLKDMCTFEKDGYKEEIYSSSTHTGTHLDAPLHMYRQGASVDRIDLSELVQEGYCIRPRVTDNEIHIDAIRAVWKPEYDGKAILINTGWDRKRSRTQEWQYGFPGLAEDTVDFFGEHGTKLIGIDTLGIEPASHQGFPVHRGLERYGITFIEDMANLHLLEIGKPYLIVALPLKLRGASGSMARVIAIDAD
ncbi:cyclase family protein [Thermogymnomonas acidicola]|nr:cyclase family protein [Thermogymnomonas acidicola]